MDGKYSDVIWYASSQYRPTPFKQSGLAGDNSVVDRVALFSDKNDNMCINFIIRQTRRPEVTAI